MEKNNKGRTKLHFSLTAMQLERQKVWNEPSDLAQTGLKHYTSQIYPVYTKYPPTKFSSISLSVHTVADTCFVLFVVFLELATRCKYKVVLTFATCFKYYQRSNVSNALRNFKTRFKRITNI